MLTKERSNLHELTPCKVFYFRTQDTVVCEMMSSFEAGVYSDVRNHSPTRVPEKVHLETMDSLCER
jgi:hypothetical protein